MWFSGHYFTFVLSSSFRTYLAWWRRKSGKWGLYHGFICGWKLGLCILNVVFQLSFMLSYLIGGFILGYCSESCKKKNNNNNLDVLIEDNVCHYHDMQTLGPWCSWSLLVCWFLSHTSFHTYLMFLWLASILYANQTRQEFCVESPLVIESCGAL